MLKEKQIVSTGGTTHYWISRCPNAAAHPLVFLHGLTADHRLFDKQMEHFAQTHTLVVWDAPAHGKSRPYEDFSYSNLAEELNVILEQESVKQPVLIGQSAGGFVAQSYLSSYPGKAAGLVCIGTCPYGPDYYSRSDFFWLRQIRWMARLFPDRVLRAVMARQCALTPRARENMLQMLSCYSKRELCHLMYLGLAGFIPEVHAFSISCPVCLIVGAHDRTGKVRAYNERWREKEGYSLYMIQEAAHNANDDRPDQVNAILERFLSQIPPLLQYK